MAELNFLRYYEKKSLIHSLHPATKLFTFVILNIVIFYSRWFLLMFICTITFFAIFTSGSSFQRMAKPLLFFSYLGIFTLLFGAIEINAKMAIVFKQEQFMTLSLYLFRLICSFLLTELLFITTKVAQINDLITLFSQKTPLFKRLDPGLYLSVMIQFIPQTFDELHRILEAMQMRGFSRRINPFTMGKVIMLPLITNMLIKSMTMAYGLRIRNMQIDRTIRLKRLSVFEALFMFMQMVLLLVAFHQHWFQFR